MDKGVKIKDDRNSRKHKEEKSRKWAMRVNTNIIKIIRRRKACRGRKKKKQQN